MAGRPEKYAALRTFFEQKAEECRRNAQREFKLRFRDLERSGVKLPESAYKHREWWANKYSGEIYGKPAHRKPWQRGGLETKNVDIVKQTVVFRLKGPFAPEATARLAEAERSQELAELKQQLSRVRKDLDATENRPDNGTRRAVNRLRKNRISELEQRIREVELDMVEKGNEPPRRGMAETPRPYAVAEDGSSKQLPCRHPIYGALKGYIRLVAGTDLTEPADPEWGERIWSDHDDKDE